MDSNVFNRLKADKLAVFQELYNLPEAGRANIPCYLFSLQNTGRHADTNIKGDKDLKGILSTV